jgi:hypothetical protein
MFYIKILNQLPYEESNLAIPNLITELNQRALVQYHQAEVRRLHQRIREDYYLERHSFT